MRRELSQSDNMRFYLFTAVRNNCLTYLTREKKQAVFMEDLDAMADTGPLLYEGKIHLKSMHLPTHSFVLEARYWIW
ncbi:hypothetical protein KE626_12900 [Chitinophaga sp. 2R12]|uniref:Uncharacterized protein n=2 Tax=Chitinophagaceae TaxID=563835 RepID=A0ABS5IZ33_9BACT|nr:hypothetical protein [Chitinophaga hostae]